MPLPVIAQAALKKAAQSQMAKQAAKTGLGKAASKFMNKPAVQKGISLGEKAMSMTGGVSRVQGVPMQQAQANVIYDPGQGHRGVAPIGMTQDQSGEMRIKRFGDYLQEALNG